MCNLDAQELAGDGLKGVCKALGIPPVLSFGTCTVALGSDNYLHFVISIKV